MPHVLPRRSLVTLATVGLVLTACAVDEPDEPLVPSPDPTATDTASPTPTGDGSPEPEPTGATPPATADGGLPDLDAQCFAEPESDEIERITYSVPADWRVEGRCDVLDPELEDLSEDQDAEGAIVIDVRPVTYAEVMADGDADTDVVSWVGARMGYQASRTTSVSTGEGLGPEGQPTTSWAFDLDPGADEGGGVLTLATGPVSGDAHALAQGVLDEIASTVVITPQAPDTVGTAPEQVGVVVRVDQDDQPYVVTFDGDCFAVRPGGPEAGPTDQQCGLEPEEGELVAGPLGDGYVVGHAPVTAIGVRAPDLPPPYGLTADVQGSTVFAFRVEEPPSRLTAVAPGGEELVTADVEG